MLTDLKPLLSVPDAAKAFGMGRDAMRALVRSDKSLPIVVVGNKRYILTQEFYKWLKEKSTNN